jgi:phosphoribosylpyrophosphate synthetase
MISLLQDRRLYTLKRAWHLCYYIPELGRNDELSNRIIEFKNHVDYISEAWAEWVVHELVNKTKINFHYLIRALESRETGRVTRNVGTVALNQLAWQISSTYNLHYEGLSYIEDALGKRRQTKWLHECSLQEKEKEIKGNYFVSSNCPDLNNKNVLIIDDLYQTGTTISEILHVLNQSYPQGNYHFLCLAAYSNYKEANDDIKVDYFKKADGLRAKHPRKQYIRRY